MILSHKTIASLSLLVAAAVANAGNPATLASGFGSETETITTGFIDATRSVSPRQALRATMAKPLQPAPLRATSSETFNPPYLNTFDNEAAIAGFTFIDANNDGKSWAFNSSVFDGVTNGYLSIGYHSVNTADDWAITPGLNLKGGQSYELTLDAWTNSFPERIEVFFGTAPTASAMTGRVIEPTEVTGNYKDSSPLHLSGSITPAADGVYYVGIHGISDPDQLYLSIDNLKISAPLAAAVPAAVADLKAVENPVGSKTVNISFKAPATDLNGDQLTSISRIELLRSDSDQPVKVFDNPAPGAELTYTDKPSRPGSYTYTAVAYNANGKGELATVTLFCGADLPDEVLYVEIAETDTDGEVTLTWQAVTTDPRGNLLPEGSVTYSIYGLDEATGYYVKKIAQDITGTSHTFTAYTGNDQTFMRFYVCAATESGEGDGRFTSLIPVGKAYKEFHESFADAKMDKYIWVTGASSDYVEIGTAQDGDYMTSQDGDNGFVIIRGKMRDMSGALYSGKISLEGIAKPVLTFYTYGYPDDQNLVIVEIKSGNGDFVKVYEKEVFIISHDLSGWTKAMIDLSEYAGQTIQFTLGGQLKNYSEVLFDNIFVGEMIEKDITLAAITAPVRVKTGTDYNVVVNIINNGGADVSGWSAELKADGVTVATSPGVMLEPREMSQLSFTLKMSPLATENVKLTAEAIFDADENPSDNTLSKPVEVTPIVSPLPTVTDLDGKAEDGAAILSWSEPDLDLGPVATVEDFDDPYADTFVPVYGDWIFSDVDGKPVCGFRDFKIPNITAGQTTGAFWTWSTVAIPIEGIPAHSGNNFLFALAPYDESDSDDWCISPALYGDAQTISFYARSIIADYPEVVDVYYSTGSTDPKDFVKVEGAGGTVPATDWTLFTAALPDGAKRFALRSHATGGFMLMIDDITYVPASITEGLSIEGYNIYRDGVRINSEPTGETTYTDTTGENGKTYTYNVTTVYSTGESRGSNDLSLSYINSGLDSVEASAIGISARDGKAIITGAEGKLVTIHALDGTTLHSATAKSTVSVDLAPGVYVVKAADTVAKILVK